MIELIAAVSSNGGIGKEDGSLLFHIKEDLEHFKEHSVGCNVVFGRKTFQSIIDLRGKPLPKRTSIVLTRDKSYASSYGEFVFNSIDKILKHHETNSENDKKIVVAGGGEVYKQFIPFANSVRLTHISKHVEDATAFFPMDLLEKYFEVSEESESYYSEEYDAYYKFVRYERKVTPNESEK